MVDQVKDILPRIQYTSSASQTVFPYPFPIFDKDDLVVVVNSVTQSEGTDYTVSGVEVEDGGDVTFTSGLNNGDIVTIYRDQAFNRLTDYQENGDFLASTVNNDFDRIVLMIQQLNEVDDRSLKFGVEDGGKTTEIDTTQTSKLIGLDANGNLFYYSAASDVETDYKTYLSLSAAVADASLEEADKGRVQGLGDFEIVASDPNDNYEELASGGLYIKPLEPIIEMYPSVQRAIDDVFDNGGTYVQTVASTLSLTGPTDFKGLGLVGNGATYNPNNFDVGDLAFIKGMRQDDGSTNRLIDDPMSSEGSAITHGGFKIVYEDGGRVFCATKGGASKRGLLYEMLTGNYVAPALPSNSLNTNWELWRIVSVACLDECIVYKKEGSKTGTWSTFNPTLTALGLSGSGSLLKAEGAESSTTGNTITYTASADRKGKMTVCFQMSSGSDTACEIRVDGSLYDTIDLSNPTTALYNFEITTTPGQHTIEITHGAAAVLRVLGCNLKSISEIDEYFDEDYDGIGVYTSPAPFYYIPRYQTSDYAFRDTIDDLWGGSYHGGETAVESAVWSLDGDTIDPTASGFIGIGRAFSVYQRTQINWSTQSLQLNNSLRFGDSQYQQAISSVGEVQIKTFHNGMLGSSVDFETMLSTTYTDDASLTYDAQLMGNSLRLEQVSKSTGRRIIVEFTPLEQNNSPDYNGFTVSNVSDSYFKLYRGFVRNADQKMVNPSWVYTVTFG